MERYEFGGYEFGSNGMVVLQICVNNIDQSRTNYSTKIEFELTPEERTALIAHLVLIK